MMLFSSLSIVIVIVIVPRRLLWWSRGMEIHILLHLLIIVQWIISHYLIETMDAPQSGCQRGTCRCGAAAPVRRGEQRGDRWGNIDDWWLHGCLIVVVVRIIISYRIQIVPYMWTDGTILIIVSVVLVLEIEIVASDRQTEMYRVNCRMVRLTVQVYLMLSCCGAYFSYFDSLNFLLYHTTMTYPNKRILKFWLHFVSLVKSNLSTDRRISMDNS